MIKIPATKQKQEPEKPKKNQPAKKQDKQTRTQPTQETTQKQTEVIDNKLVNAYASQEEQQQKEAEVIDLQFNDAYAQFAQHKKRMLQALELTMGIVTTACKHAKVGRRTHYDWYRDDPAYKAEVDFIRDISIDMSESMLYKNIQKGKEASIIFHLKTIGKNRGYVERTEITGRDGKDLLPFSWDGIHNTNTET